MGARVHGRGGGGGLQHFLPNVSEAAGVPAGPKHTDAMQGSPPRQQEIDSINEASAVSQGSSSKGAHLA